MEQAFKEKTPRGANNWASLTRARDYLEDNAPDVLAFYSGTKTEVMAGTRGIIKKTLLSHLGRLNTGDLVPIAKQIADAKLTTAQGIEHIRSLRGSKPDYSIALVKACRLADDLLIRHDKKLVAQILREAADIVEGDTD